MEASSVESKCNICYDRQNVTYATIDRSLPDKGYRLIVNQPRLWYNGKYAGLVCGRS